MEEERNKPNVAIIICSIIGILLIVVSIRGIIKIDSYKGETEAVFSYSIEYTDDGHTYYHWYYDYVVNGEKYQVYGNNHSEDRPKSNVAETVLYNVNNPKEAVLSSDHSSIILLIVGCIFLLGPMILNKMSTKNYDARTKAKMFAWLWTGMVIAFFMIIFIQAGFSFSGLLNTTGIAPLVILGLFFAIGVFLLKKAYDPTINWVANGNTLKMQREDEEDLTSNRINDFINDNADNINKIENKIENMRDKISGIVAIVMGLILVGVISLFVFFPMLFSNGNATYILNGKEVSKEEFFFDPLTLFVEGIFYIAGIVTIIKGIILIKKSRSNDE